MLKNKKQKQKKRSAAETAVARFAAALAGWLMPSGQPGQIPAPTFPQSAFDVNFFLLSVHFSCQCKS